ncbi:hypothetical protein BDN70DRAFT_532654 [Pholiota conissans]|uniref:Uncharacterized protein n=1 Tax=Pholiota conissans TaxID=109636 RepID=A0A9P6CZU0_9AGAR|nr:hypothetical protein BDN70DRAFT_532654 [Pholiota conissans]
MGSICLSSASILRCTTLSEIQSIILIIPTALEVIFSTSLIFVNWKGGKRHLLLTAEGWVYFILSAIELVFDIIPGARDNLSLFRASDVGIGVASFLPIFFYTFFLFILTGNDLAETLPKRLKNVAKLSLILFVPAIIIFNEIASFVGVIIRRIPSPKSPTQTIVAVGFSSNREESLWAFFTSTTLALLVVFQASVFCFAFFRLCRALLAQRRIENEGLDKAHFVNGTGWLCASLKIGALESVVGFAGGAFGIALTRRIMRMLARACLCIGIVKGVDAVEDFRMVQRELRQSKDNDHEAKNPLRQLQISNPRFSTFRQLSPTAREFHAIPSSKRTSIGYITEKSETPKRPHYSTWSQRQSTMLQSGLPGMKNFASIKEAKEKQRVTILYNQGTPRLYMRFSTLDVPSPALIAEKVKSRPRSELLESYTKSQVPLHRGHQSVSMLSEEDSIIQVPAPFFHRDHPDSESNRDSMNSIPSFGAYEIVDARKLPQMTAMAQVYQPPTTVNSASAPNATSAMNFPEPVYQAPPIRLDERQSQDYNARVKSMASVKSVPDSIKAVRELTHQFPGPPGLSQIRPPEIREFQPAAMADPAPLEVVENSVWEEDSRISAQRLSVMSMPQVISSPSQLIFNKGRISQERSPSDADVHLAYAGIENAATDSPRARGGKVPITPGGYSRMSTNSRNKAKRRSSQKPIDPFNDDEASLRLSPNPVYAPVGVPLRQSLMPAGKAKPQPVTADVDTPTTAFSEITRLQETIVEGRIDPFLDFGTALDSGKSRQFRPSLPPMPQPAISQRRPSISVIPTHARKLSKSEEKLSRIVQWVDTSANVAMAEAQANPEIPITPLVESPTEILPSEKPRDNNLQNLHDRGPSMDALSIPWMKNPNISAEEKRRLGGPATVVSSALRPQLTRITTVGKAPSRRTPAPMRSAHARGTSLHLQPIMVPPRNGNLPEAVQIEYGSVESPEGMGVLRDSEVLANEGGLKPISNRF